jgi:hypothetical protein
MLASFSEKTAFRNPLSQDPFCVPGHRPGHQVNAVPQLQLHQRIVKNRFLALHFLCQIHISKVPLIEIYDPSCVQGSCGKNRPVLHNPTDGDEDFPENARESILHQ